MAYPLSEWRRFILEQNIEQCLVSCVIEVGSYPPIRRENKVDFEVGRLFTRTEPGYYAQQAILLALQTVQVEEKFLKEPKSKAREEG